MRPDQVTGIHVVIQYTCTQRHMTLKQQPPSMRDMLRKYWVQADK